MKTRFHAHFRGAAQSLVAMCAVLAVGAALLIVLRHSRMALLPAVAMAPVVALLVWRVYRRLHELHSNAQRHLDTAAEAERHYFQVLREVAKAIEGRSRFLAGRSERIAQLVIQMAGKLGLDAERAQLLGMAAQVHDIGLLSVPEKTLLKPTGLRGDEFAAVKNHCAAGVEILRPLTFLRPVLPAVRHHHERMNGTGYPDGLYGESIPLEARILAVADSYDAMTHDRPHRGALTGRQAVAELIRCAGAGYDASCVAALAELTHTADLLPAEWEAGSGGCVAEGARGDANGDVVMPPIKAACG